MRDRLTVGHLPLEQAILVRIQVPQPNRISQMRDTKKAFLWIVDILERNKVVYKISGGFVARIYGVKRELADIDIEVPERDLSIIARETKSYIKFGPERYKDESWDLELLTLEYEGQEIDIACAEATIFNQETKQWEKTVSDLQDANLMEVYGKIIPIEKMDTLISYKNKLGRDVDIEDVNQLLEIKKKMVSS